MSVQFGTCNFDGKPVDPHDLDEVRALLAPYGPDEEGLICKDNFAVVFRGLYTTSSSKHSQPFVSQSGMVITWDGRLDNRQSLIERLGHSLSSASSDLEIVATAIERSGSMLAELNGDWAVSVWNPRDHSLVLAKDYLGARHLYYTLEKDHLTWCTILEPLVLLARGRLELEMEYLAGWLSFFPATHLTPYRSILAVPPSSFVRLAPGSHAIKKYWDFDPAKRIIYRRDGEYEEHFRSVFSQSVARRTRSHLPVMAELSGGMDSSSIVCVADEIAISEPSMTSRVETISYFNDQEPNWDESSFFTLVERKRGRVGRHVDLAKQTLAAFCSESDSFISVPGGVGSSDRIADTFEDCMKACNSRVLLSGVGGDEVAGGIPTPCPEISDLLVTFEFGRLAHQLKNWALEKRTPWFHLFFEAFSDFLPKSLRYVPSYRRPLPWLRRSFMKRYRKALSAYDTRLKVFGALPSFQQNLSTLEALRRQLEAVPLPVKPPYEKRYPYLDRDFLEFMYAVPRTQIVRPGQRRSLMRRALRGIVPDAILNRPRKAYVSRGPLQEILSDSATIGAITSQMESESLQVVDRALLLDNLERARRGQEIHIVGFLRTVFMEVWLRSLRARSILASSSDQGRGDPHGFWFRSISRETT